MKDMHNYRIIKINGKCISEHRHVWECTNGKILKPYILHHINGIKDDNRIENLAMVTYSEHAKIHGWKTPDNGKRFEVGHIPKSRILSEKEARKVKGMIEQRGTLSLRKLACLLGLKSSLIQDISAGRSYIYI